MHFILFIVSPRFFYFPLFPVFLFLLAILLLITTTSSHIFSFFHSNCFFFSFHFIAPYALFPIFILLFYFAPQTSTPHFLSPLLFFPLIVKLSTFYMVVPHPLLSSFTALNYFIALVNHLITCFPISSSL